MVISKETDSKIEEMQGQGFSYSQIAKTLNISKGYISKFMSGAGTDKQDLKEISDNESFTDRSQIVHNDNLNDNKAYLNEQLQTFKDQIQTEFIGVKADILDYIKEELPLSKTELLEIKKENKSIKGKIEFIKKVLREFNPDIYKKVINEVFK